MPVDKAIKSGFVDVPGARLYYEIAGEGDPVVLLHGGFLDGRMWDVQFPFQARSRVQVIVLQARPGLKVCPYACGDQQKSNQWIWAS